MSIEPINLETSAQVQQFLQRMLKLKIIECDARGHIVHPSEKVTEHFIIAADGRTYFIEDLRRLSQSEADLLAIRFNTKKGGTKTLGDLKREIADVDNIKSFYLNEKLAGALVKIRVVTEDKAMLNNDLTNLPEEIIKQIGSYLGEDIEGLGRLAQTSKQFKRILEPELTSQRNNLQNKIDACQKKYDELNQRINSVRMRYDMEQILSNNPGWEMRGFDIDKEKVKLEEIIANRKLFTVISAAATLTVGGTGVAVAAILTAIAVSVSPVVYVLVILTPIALFAGMGLVAFNYARMKFAKKSYDDLNIVIPCVDLLKQKYQIEYELKKLSAQLKFVNKPRLTPTKTSRLMASENKVTSATNASLAFNNSPNDIDDSTPLLESRKTKRLGFFQRIRAKHFGKKTTGNTSRALRQFANYEGITVSSTEIIKNGLDNLTISSKSMREIKAALENPVSLLLQPCAFNTEPKISISEISSSGRCDPDSDIIYANTYRNT